jgi:3-mercaptopyruvate sulfurtransferase SseA
VLSPSRRCVSALQPVGKVTRARRCAVRLADNDTLNLAYCRSGRCAAQPYWVLRNLGFWRIKLYANSVNAYLLDRDAALITANDP